MIALPGSEFDSGAVAVTDASTYVEVANIQAEGRDLVIDGAVGAGGALAHLKVTQCPIHGGTHRTLAEDTDFATATAAWPWVLPAAPHTTAAAGTFQIRLASGAYEYTIWAKKATTSTTLRIRGRAI